MVIGECRRRVFFGRLVWLLCVLSGVGLDGEDGGKIVESENRRSSKSWASSSNRLSSFDIFLLCSIRCIACILLQKMTLSSIVGKSSNVLLWIGIGVSWWPWTIPSLCPIRNASSSENSNSSSKEGELRVAGSWRGSTKGRINAKLSSSSSSQFFPIKDVWKVIELLLLLIFCA